MKKMNYKTICEMLNVNDELIKKNIESEEVDYFELSKKLNETTKLNANTLGDLIFNQLGWVKKSENPKFYELKNIANYLFLYKVNTLGEKLYK